MSGKRFAARRISLTRRLGLDHNPLRRRSDKIETAAVWVATALLIAALPMALLIGFAVYQQNKAISDEQYGQRHSVAAQLDGSQPTVRTDSTGATIFEAQARWVTQDGTHIGEIQVPVNSAPESVVHIWTNDQGAQVAAPLTWESALGRGAIAGLATIGGLGLMLWGAIKVGKWRLNRRRFQAWEQEWQHIDPHWTQPTG